MEKTMVSLGWSSDVAEQQRTKNLWMDESEDDPCSAAIPGQTLLQQPLPILDSLTLRPLRTWDRIAVETLCNESFPIQYPDCWYDEVVSGGLQSTGLFDGEQLAAMIVSETKNLYDCNAEDQGILPDTNTKVMYILSIAVNRKFRRMGLATRLLNNLFATLVEQPPYPRAVFLHVLSTNSAALSFYKTHGFQFHASLPEYYRIGEVYADGCTYVKYTNGMQAPVTFTDVCRSFGNTICMPLKAICKMLSF